MSEAMLSPLFTWRSAIASEHGPKDSTTRHVLLTLSLHMNEKGGSCYPSTRTLADETGLTRRTVEKHLAKAHKQGWLSKKRHGLSGQRWKRNEYAAQIPKEARRKLEKERKKGGEGDSPRPRKGGESHAEGGESDDTKVGNLTTKGGEGDSHEDVREGDTREDASESESAPAREDLDFSFLPSRDRKEHLEDIKETHRTVLKHGNGELQVRSLIVATHGRYKTNPTLMRNVKRHVDSAGWARAIAAHTIAAKKGFSADAALDQWELKHARVHNIDQRKQEVLRKYGTV